MKIVKASFVAAAVALAVVGAGVPAQAHSGHYIYVYGGGYERGKAKFDGGWLTVCDTRVDGKRVRAHLKSYTGNIYYSGWAPSQACTTEGHPTSIVQFRVCAESYGCSSWHNRY